MSARNLAGDTVATVPTHKRNRWRDNHDRFVGFLLLMPLVALILGLTVYPIAQVMQLSTQQQGLFSTESTFVGLQNFQNVVQHEAFGRSVKNTFTFAFGSLALQMAIGLAVALLCRGKSFGPSGRLASAVRAGIVSSQRDRGGS